MKQVCSSSKHDEFIRSYLEALDCPRALTVYLMYTNHMHKELSELEFVPSFYNDLQTADSSLSATKFLSKATFLHIESDKKVVAIEKFLAAELQCKETNQRIFRNPGSARDEEIISIASRKISNILGNLAGNSNAVDEFLESCDHGPGATASIRRAVATKPGKFDLEVEISTAGYDFMGPLWNNAYPLWRVSDKFRKNDTSKIVTVPKNAKTDRVIAIEPGLSLWCQKGIGSMIRRRLLRVGIDLNDQRHNARLSRVASKFNQLATIDFSSASDTISKATVELLLPREWHLFLSSFRSTFGLLPDGSQIQYEKFSSMGNGYTFELETLIFFALAFACCKARGVNPQDVSVYGDDVILPTGVVDDFASVCSYLGFTINTTKSHSSSYYRESCGDHYWNGVNIKPFFLKERLHEGTAYFVANSVRILAHRRNAYGCDRRLLHCWESVVLGFNRLKTAIPIGIGDIGFVVSLDEILKYGLTDPLYAKPFQRGWFIRAWTSIAYSVYTDTHGLLLSKLKTKGSALDPLNFHGSFRRLERPKGADGNRVSLPGRTRACRLRVYVSQWDDLGPWL